MDEARRMASLRGRAHARIARWESSFAARYSRVSTKVLRVSVGIVFLWFGVLKFVPGGSPAEHLAIRCTRSLSFNLVSPDVCRLLLAIMETSIGVGLVTGVLLRLTLAVYFVHMAGVFSVFLLAPDAIWAEDVPMGLTLEGQYVMKNIVLIAACLTVLLHNIRDTAPPAPPPAKAPTDLPPPTPENRHRPVPAASPLPEPPAPARASPGAQDEHSRR